MARDLLVLDSNVIRGKYLQYRLSREARCDYARTPETAFEQIREKLRVGEHYEVIVLPEGQMRFAHGIESIYRTYGSTDVSGPRFVVMASAHSRGKDVSTDKPGRFVVEVSGPVAASRVALGR